MKQTVGFLASLLSALAITSVSQANMKPPGALQDNYCAENLEAGVTRVCFASKVAVQGRFLTVTHEDGMREVYNIIGEQEIVHVIASNTIEKVLTVQLELLINPNGNVSIPFNPEQHTLFQTQDVPGDLQSLTLQGTLSGDSVINARGFNVMYHTL